jgi:hypothetical protein
VKIIWTDIGEISVRLDVELLRFLLLIDTCEVVLVNLVYIQACLKTQKVPGHCEGPGVRNRDGFTKSIKIWSQKNPLLGKHITTPTRLIIEEKCFLCGHTETVC